MSLENNIILSALGLLLFFTFTKHRDIVEHFNSGVPMQARRVHVNVDKKQHLYSAPSVSNNMYMVPSKLQMNLPPRSASVGYGARILYDTPDKSLRADNMGSMEYNKNKTQIREGFTNPPQTTYVASSIPTNLQQKEIPSSSALGGEKTDKKVNEIGIGEETPIPVDVYVYGLQKSPKVRDSDWIRGDVPIPVQNQGWFNVSANPSVDLRQGALAVLGGVNNETAKELMALKASSLGTSQNVGSGIKYTVEKSHYLSSSLGGGGDIEVKTTAFP